MLAIVIFFGLFAIAYHQPFRVFSLRASRARDIVTPAHPPGKYSALLHQPFRLPRRLLPHFPRPRPIPLLSYAPLRCQGRGGF